ncbi:thymidine kinase [Persicobacter psychrovividus]|uniref:Thymidine kinase n=1 Tax=Persicobacter psychrovividus TaxID=387638 RepID=A0ABN6L9H0_9BACT|nr:thymidine kinase [Persicobacter psychrovividus]
MFIEPHFGGIAQAGWVEVICGSMFSGKTEELIRRINRAIIAKQKVGIFKPAVDTRYAEAEVVSHNANAVVCVPVKNAAEILHHINEFEVIGIDEAQFFDLDLVDVANKLANKGKRVILAGLDMDFEGVPFGPMPGLMATAEFVTKVNAICAQCGSVASYSFRTTMSEEQVVLGEKDAYEPRCRKCYNEGMNEKQEQHNIQTDSQ